MSVTGARRRAAGRARSLRVVIAAEPVRLDAATVLLQWATGGLLFLWVTGRRQEVGVGYGWLLRGTYLLVLAGALAAGVRFGPLPVREVAVVVAVVAVLAALVLSVARRREALSPHVDLVAPAAGVVGLVAAGLAAGGQPVVALARTLVGAAFLGAVTDAMLLGHWYLVQPGLPRRHLEELVSWVGRVWPLEVVTLLLPTGMLAVFAGEVDDGWGGQLGWFWAVCAMTTILLVVVTRAALKERSYSAVMAATGLLYLAILTAFGTDLVARAVLGG